MVWRIYGGQYMVWRIYDVENTRGGGLLISVYKSLSVHLITHSNGLLVTARGRLGSARKTDDLNKC